jgi:hypothetical protein
MRGKKMSRNFYAVGDVNSTERGSGARANHGKVSLTLVPFHVLAGVARVFMGGKLKYAAWNWAKGMPWSTATDCLFRHLFKWWYLGEDIDPESGEHHLDHAICNLLMLRHYLTAYKEGDDRPPTDITGFNEALVDFTRCFDEEEYLRRNPSIKQLIEERSKPKPKTKATKKTKKEKR